jgi:hypothetical protein
MWHIKITLWQRIEHLFGKHIPVKWHDGSETCLICKKVLRNPNVKQYKAGGNINADQLVYLKDGKVYGACSQDWHCIVGTCNVNEQEEPK